MVKIIDINTVGINSDIHIWFRDVLHDDKPFNVLFNTVYRAMPALSDLTFLPIRNVYAAIKVALRLVWIVLNDKNISA